MNEDFDSWLYKWSGLDYPNETDWDILNAELDKYAKTFDRVPLRTPIIEKDYGLDEGRLVDLNALPDML